MNEANNQSANANALARTAKPFAPATGYAQVAGAAVAAERKRQHDKWGEQNHDMMTWLAILHEETGELAEACLHEKFGGPEAENVMKEAVQVATVGMQIVEFLLRVRAERSGEEAEAAHSDKLSDSAPLSGAFDPKSLKEKP